MARRTRLELEQLHSGLLAAYRELPDPASSASLKYAAEAAHCSPQVARRAFGVGLGKGLRAIRDLLSEEKLMARSVLTKERLAERIEASTELAKLDAIESRASAGALVVRQQAALSELLGFLSVHLKKFGERIAGQEFQAMSLPELTSALRGLVSAASELQRQENLILGDPTSIIAGQLTVETAQTEVSIEEAKREVEAATRALQEIERVDIESSSSGALH